MSLLQSPRRPSSAALALDLHEVGDPGRPFPGSGGFGDDETGDRVDLGRELDLATERPHASSKAGRGPGLLVASIVTTSIVLGTVIMFVRGDHRPAASEEPAAPAGITEVLSPPAASVALEPAPAQPTPPAQPSRVATQRVATPAPAKTAAAPARSEITPAAIAPAGPARASTPAASEAGRATEPTEASGALPPGLHLPPPVFDDSEPAKPEPTPPAAAEPVDDAADARLPGVEAHLPPLDEPGAAAPEQPAPSESAALPTPTGAVGPLAREPFDRLPARADRPAS